MTGILIAGFFMGALGSLHCVGMCGPLALSIPVAGERIHNKFIGSLLYNIGRVVTYAVIGALAGLLGSGFALFGYQQVLSISFGILIIFFLAFPSMGRKLENHFLMASFFSKLRSHIGKLFVRKNYQSVFAIGLLNGLLPCGLIYMALATSVSAGTILNSSLFMAAFGLGTLPMMWSVAFFGGFINVRLRQRIRKLFPYMMFLMACLLIIRGMGLGIPYISPDLPGSLNHQQGMVECHQ